ncbi:MAG: DUF5681 domain-containing protein [Brevundimonas sp.]|uniref:DUF5681 domain-containing protein n=1 Tax=Brevundimonas sp. TaxID=1871086 RepID=UPI0027350ED4|nr:DUF5681 domain-containing protein [Brevundimonas sp.]MDP3405225.1 DUF5681 domain-containing protein [Brevundimonas sp.]
MTSSPKKNSEVGYGRPPVSSRFQPNQSGNPAGRPKGSKNIRTLVRIALDERVSITRNGESKWMSKRAIAACQQVDKAVMGDTKAFMVITQLDADEPLGGPGAAGDMLAESEIPPEAYDEMVQRFLDDLQQRGAGT